MIDTARALASLRREFPASQIDPAWVQACAQALADDGQDPSAANIREQFLFSDLAASTLPSNLIPPLDAHLIHLFPRPTLVQLISITEIGHSAFQLQTTQEQRKDVLSGATRIRRMDDDERLDGEDDLNGDDGGRLPAYPRSMLKMKITDGERIIKAIEYKRLPAVKLAETPLGAKMILHNVRALRGTLLLSPENTQFLGYQVAHLEAQQPVRFTNSLLERMGKPVHTPDEIGLEADGDDDTGAALAPRDRAPTAPVQNAPRRLTLPPAPSTRTVRTPALPQTTSAPRGISSPYFGNRNATASSSRQPGPTVRRPARAAERIIQDPDEDDDAEYDDSFIRQIDAAEARATSTAPRHTADHSSDYGMDDELDSAILNQLDEVEATHRPATATAIAKRSRTTASSTSTSDTLSGAAEARGRGRAQLGTVSARPTGRKRKASHHQPIIMDSEEDEGEDKENAWPDVIEVSD